MTYQDASEFSQTYGMIYLFILFLIVVAYALWPKNKDKFEKAAQIPFEEGNDVQN